MEESQVDFNQIVRHHSRRHIRVFLGFVYLLLLQNHAKFIAFRFMEHQYCQNIPRHPEHTKFTKTIYTIRLRIVPPPLNSTHQPPISPANLGWVVHDIFQQFEQGDITCFLRLGKTCDCKFATNAGSISFQLHLMI